MKKCLKLPFLNYFLALMQNLIDLLSVCALNCFYEIEQKNNRVKKYTAKQFLVKRCILRYLYKVFPHVPSIFPNGTTRISRWVDCLIFGLLPAEREYLWPWTESKKKTTRLWTTSSLFTVKDKTQFGCRTPQERFYCSICKITANQKLMPPFCFRW